MATTKLLRVVQAKLLLYLRLHTSNGRMFPESIRAVADCLKIHPNGARHALKVLRDYGMVEITESTQGSRTYVNLYSILPMGTIRAEKLLKAGFDLTRVDEVYTLVSPLQPPSDLAALIPELYAKPSLPNPGKKIEFREIPDFQVASDKGKPRSVEVGDLPGFSPRELRQFKAKCSGIRDSHLLYGLRLQRYLEDVDPVIYTPGQSAYQELGRILGVFSADTIDEVTTAMRRKVLIARLLVKGELRGVALPTHHDDLLERRQSDKRTPQVTVQPDELLSKDEVA